MVPRTLKSGTGEAVLTPVEQHVVDATLQVFMEDAVRYAIQYCTESGRSTLHPRDIELGMKFVGAPSHGWLERPEVMEKIRRAALSGSEDTGSEDSGYDADDDTGDESESSGDDTGDESESSGDDTGDESESTGGDTGGESGDEWVPTVCDDPDSILNRMNEAEAEFDQWEPSSQSGHLVKYIVESTEHGRMETAGLRLEGPRKDPPIRKGEDEKVQYVHGERVRPEPAHRCSKRHGLQASKPDRCPTRARSA